MYTQIKKTIFSMIRNKRKNVSLFDIDGKITPFKHSNYISTQSSKNREPLISSDYLYYDELVAVDHQDLDALKKALSDRKELFFSYSMFSFICKYYYDRNDTPNLLLCSQLIPNENELETNVLYSAYYSFLYLTKEIYANPESRSELEDKMLKSVLLFRDLGMEITDDDIEAYKSYLKSEYIGLTRI